MKNINCPHKKDWIYMYNFKSGKDKIEVNLCAECEMFLLVEMKKQEVIETKVQSSINEIFLKNMDTIYEGIIKLKKEK